MNTKITQEELEKSFHNTNFGTNPDFRGLVNEAISQVAGGFPTGHTISCILNELGLQRSNRGRGKQILTVKGEKYMAENSLTPLTI